MSSEVPLLTVRRLTVSFHTSRGTSVPAVRGVDLSIDRGECLAIVGASGSGKSVTARALLGLAGRRARVDAETLEFDGEQLLEFSERRWRELRGARAALVLQDALSALDPLRRVGAEVAEPLIVHRRGGGAAWRADRVQSLLREVGVPDPTIRARQFPHELSGGLRQRALIASAIAAGPSLLIADEPTTALDVAVQRQVLDLLAGLRDAGTALLLISHDLSVVAQMADRVAVMADGVIVEQGTPHEILHRPQHRETRALIAAAPGLSSPAPAPAIRRSSSTPAALEVVSASKGYRSPDGSWRQAVDDVSLRVHAGEALGVVGESGSGKSTTAQLAMAMLRPDAGEVLLHGAAWSSLPERRRRPLRHRIQLVSQNPLDAFDPRFTVERLVAEAIGRPSRRGAAAARPQVEALLERVGLDNRVLHRRGHELSGGQRQRVAIARALAPRPDVLVCDEPVSALDVAVQAKILALLDELRRELGVALLFISHDLAVVRDVCDRVVVMKDGRIVERGAVARVWAAPEHPYTRSLLAHHQTVPPAAPISDRSPLQLVGTTATPIGEHT